MKTYVLILGLQVDMGSDTNEKSLISPVCVSYLQDSLGQAGLMSEAGPVFAVRVVLLGKIRLKRSELLPAKTRSNPLSPPAGPSTCHPVIQS